MARPDPRLQTQLLTWLLGPLLALLVLDTVLAYGTSLAFANRAQDRSLQEIAREVVLYVRLDAAGRPRLEIPPAAQRMLLENGDDRLAYRVSTLGGASLGGAQALALPDPPPRTPGNPVFYDAQWQDAPVRVAAVVLQPEIPGASVPPVLVQVAETTHQRRRMTMELLANAVVPQLVLILLATVLVYVGVSRGLLPLARLRSEVSGRSHRDLAPIALDRVPGEVRPLVEAVNELMQRLGKTLDFQSRFIADAAHQFKTPVAGLKVQIELALREEDPQRLRRSMAQLYLGVERLSRLVQQLLSLARNEPGATESVQLRPLDLDAFALEISMEWVPQAIHHGVDLGFEGAGGPVLILADGDRLRELVNNLIDNAVRYSRKGGRATVAVTQAAGAGGRLSISDDGPSIPVEERQRIFERFHRLLGTPADGSGLGLAIVSEIATLHGATVSLAEDVDGIGNTFHIEFPPLPAEPAPPAA